MAIFRSLTFDGVNSLDYGIYITGEAVYNAPERAVEMVTIPGKNGALAIDQGRFENIEVTYHAGCFADNQADFAEKVMKFRNALASRYTYKKLTDEYHSDEYRLGLYKSGLEVDAVHYSTAGEFDITFDCKPQRFLTSGETALTPSDYIDTQTATGEIVTIDSDGSLGVKALKVALEPIQSLNGYDHPWAGGAGKNKYPIAIGKDLFEDNVNATHTTDNDVLTVNCTSVNDSGVYATSASKLRKLVVASTGTYTWSADIKCDKNASIVIGCQGKTRLTVSATTQWQRVSVTDTYDGSPFAFTIYNKSGEAVSVQVKNFTFAEGTDSAYYPYENICPISGRDSVITQRTGKNLADGNFPSVFNASHYNLLLAYLQVGTYTLSTNRKSGIVTYVRKSEVPIFGGEAIAVSPNGAPCTFTVSESGWYFAHVYRQPTSPTWEELPITEVQLEVGSTATDYEPYQGTTYTTALGRTVYGGTLDVVSGELTVTHAIRTFDGTEDWRSPDSSSICWLRDDTLKKTSNYEGTIIASTMPTAGTRQHLRDDFECGISGYESSGVDNYWYIKAPNQTTQTNVALKAWLQANNAQVCYELANPQTIQLTPQEVQLITGQNNVWSDASEVTVTYGVHPYYNPSPFDSKPLIKVTGTGTIGIGEYILTITGSATQTLYIDCETMEIYTYEGTVPTGASSLVSINKNDFPVLKPGINNISVGSGITAAIITPRWWRI